MKMSKILKGCLIGFISVWFILCLAAFVQAADITLAWDAPTTNADGTPLTDLAGYKIYHALMSGGYVAGTGIDVGKVLTKTLTNFCEGTYYFVATAYDTSGNESAYSNEVFKTIKIAPASPVMYVP